MSKKSSAPHASAGSKTADAGKTEKMDEKEMKPKNKSDQEDKAKAKVSFGGVVEHN